MILHKHKFILVHIPRTGGSSIEQMLRGEQMGGFRDYHKETFEEFSERTRLYEKHLTATQIRDMCPKWDTYFKFSMVRNPWCRVACMYHMPFYERINILSGKTLSYFMSQWSPEEWESTDPQCSAYLDDKVDYIGRFENYREECRLLCEKLDVPFSLPHLEKTEHDHYSKYYNAETRELVGAMFADDIIRFGYEFETR